jgi:hypothetical protein
MSVGEIIWGFIGFFLTIMVLSYLLGDNFFFRLAAYIFLGVTMGYLVILILHQILWPYLALPLIEGGMTERLWLIAPIGLILMLLISQIRRFNALGSIPLAFLAGVAVAVVIAGAIFGTLIPQSAAVVNAFDPRNLFSEAGGTWPSIFDAVLMLVGTTATLGFFYFGSRRARAGGDNDSRRPAFFEALGNVGQVFVGITLGAVFAGVFSTALLALIDRLIFVGDFFTRLFGGGS